MRRRIIHSSTVDLDSIAGRLNRGRISPNANLETASAADERGQTRTLLLFEYKNALVRVGLC